jgi:hypothetical protein
MSTIWPVARASALFMPDALPPRSGLNSTSASG